MENFDLILKEERELTGLTQTQAAKLLLVPYRTWQDWEAGKRVPPAHVRKAILYSLNAVREDLMVAELYAQIQSGLLNPDSMVDVERDGYERIIDWRNPNNKISISYQMKDGGEIKSLDTLRFGEKMRARDALQEMYLRTPYLLDEEIAELYPEN